ncbi:MAG: fluoride efflux transporter CrcB [Myxococcota bacterium]|nr:fluoride efflux transporter CrcB [Myxococcota bacterium]
MTRFFWVCFAGAMGTGARYVVGLTARRSAIGASFPWATLAVNVVGCFLMSVVAYASAKRIISADTRATLATGFLGGLTTYSAFNWETLAFLRDSAWKIGLLNVGVTVIGCMAAGVLGLAFARAVLGG